MSKHKVTMLIAILLVIFVLFVLVELLIINLRGITVDAPEIPRESLTVGKGKKISYVIMGDSTSISQGSDYKDGYAVASTNHLAKKFEATAINLGVSGARANDVLVDQLPKALEYKPDIVLIAVGANDATHFTKGSEVRDSMQQIIDGLKQSNQDVQIIVTGSPAMDSVSRFPTGAKQLMGLRTAQVNRVFDKLISKNNLIHAPIAKETRDAFLADPTLTASDQFHPNARGYALWIPVINKAIDQAIANLE